MHVDSDKLLRSIQQLVWPQYVFVTKIFGENVIYCVTLSKNAADDLLILRSSIFIFITKYSKCSFMKYRYQYHLLKKPASFCDYLITLIISTMMGPALKLCCVI